MLKATCDSLADQPFEIVERKGLGHPDTICDAVMEEVAVELAQAYLKLCGRVLHFNADKGLLVAGQVDCRPGGGHVITPMRLVMGDRATFEWRKKRVPVEEIAERVASTWFRQHLPHVDPFKHLTCQVELKPASAELQSVSGRLGGPVANDTSAAVGYAPFTPTERLVFQVEQFLNSTSFKKAFPATGQDVKVLGVRRRDEVALTVAMPLLVSGIRTESQYFACKAEVLKALQSFVKQKAAPGLLAEVTFNALDRRGAGVEGMYLSLLGTSAEAGDSGQVGRGNRVCGVISLRRPASAEAAAGKNPVAHVGKIYNVLAHVLAEQIHRNVKGLRGVTVWLTSQIGRPVSSPQFVMVEVHLAQGVSLASVEPLIGRQVQQALRGITPFCQALAKGDYAVC
ncbi:MAG: methionine adenosyltransferase [Nitrospirota bacterium]|nr:methionine adenosyltransferase [Nitrospirota bacterium]